MALHAAFRHQISGRTPAKFVDSTGPGWHVTNDGGIGSVCTSAFSHVCPSTSKDPGLPGCLLSDDNSACSNKSGASGQTQSNASIASSVRVKKSPILTYTLQDQMQRALDGQIRPRSRRYSLKDLQDRANVTRHSHWRR